MADLPTRTLLADALTAAGEAHDEYERVILKGVVDVHWSGFYTAYVLGAVGDFVEASRLATLLEEVDTADDWAEVAADHVLMKLRS